MTYTTYFEIGGHVLACDTSVLARPPLSFAAASSLRSGRGDSSGTVASPQAVRTAEAPHTPKYVVGVGQGNPLFWLASAALIRGIQVLEPAQMTAV